MVYIVIALLIYAPLAYLRKKTGQEYQRIAFTVLLILAAGALIGSSPVAFVYLKAAWLRLGVPVEAYPK